VDSTLTAIYENGVLRPLQPVPLRERQKVRIQLLPDEPDDAVDRVLQTLLASGALTAPSGHSDVKPMTDAKRRELADRLGNLPGKPLSEIIIEERGPR
jgi:predicted DNA-binding antitoxin AbrB/MazE fold protein